MDIHPNNSTKSWQNTEGKAILYFQKDSTNAHLEYGQCVWVKLVLKKITNEPSISFDYARFLARKQIYYQGYVQSQNTVFCSEYNGNFLIKNALILQSNLIHILTKVGLDGREFTLASALLLGQMGDMDEDLQQAYRSAGLIHILCVSGLHIGLFATVLLSILSFLQNKRWLLILKLSIVCACIWIYAFIVGLSPSVLRSTVMFSFVSLGQCFNRENDIYRSLLSSAFLLLLINPYTLFSIGFQLSYLAVIGIVCFQKLFLKIWHPKYKICKYLWELIGVSISAQLATTPLIIYYFHQFPNYFLLSNIVGSPLSSLLLPLGMSILFLAHIYLPIAMGMAYLFIWTLRILNTSVLYIEKLPHALWNIQLSLWGSLLLYALILFSFGAIVKQKKQFVFASLCSLWGLIIVF
ncbi:MAG: ComEC/Rec2 family competence protein, partial [Bacteroidales bacterium]